MGTGLVPASPGSCRGNPALLTRRIEASYTRVRQSRTASPVGRLSPTHAVGRRMPAPPRLRAVRLKLSWATRLCVSRAGGSHSGFQLASTSATVGSAGKPSTTASRGCPILAPDMMRRGRSWRPPPTRSWQFRGRSAGPLACTLYGAAPPAAEPPHSGYCVAQWACLTAR